MSDRDWTDRIVGDRMAIDRQFNDRITASEFSRQQWGLIMTAVEFDIEHPGDDERARLVADTSRVPDVLPELDRVEQGRAAMGPGGAPDADDSGGGLISGIKSALGLSEGDGGGVDAGRLAAAERLADEYASDLQARLEEKGKWGEVRAAAADDQ